MPVRDSNVTAPAVTLPALAASAATVIKGGITTLPHKYRGERFKGVQRNRCRKGTFDRRLVRTVKSTFALGLSNTNPPAV